MTKEEADKFKKEIDAKKKSILKTGAKSMEGVYLKDGKYRSIDPEKDYSEYWDIAFSK